MTQRNSERASPQDITEIRSSPAVTAAHAALSLPINVRAPRNRSVHTLDVTPGDAVPSFVLKSLFHPVLTVLALLACVALWGRPFNGSYILLGALGFLVTGDLFNVSKVQARGALARWLRPLLSIALRWLPAAALIWLLIVVAGIQDRFDPRVYISWMVFTPVILWLGEVLMFASLRRAGARTRSQRRAVIVGVNELGLQLHRTLRGELQATEVLGFFEDRRELPPEVSVRVLGRTHDVAQYVVRNRVQRVYITLPMTRQQRITELLRSLNNSTASIYFIPDLLGFDPLHARLDVVAGLPVIALRESPLFGVHALGKRLFDLIGSAILICLCAPILLIVAVGVRLTSPGRVLFRQNRFGLNGDTIQVWKFRSMSVVEDGEVQFKAVAPSDARVTSFGRFIRRTSLDELPQLFNVLLGNMSLVGPRPHVVAMNERYRQVIPRYMVRHKIKPGITGWAQVNGCRGGDDLESMRARIRFDLYYLRNWSLGFDLRILLRTVVVLLKEILAG